MEKTQYDSMVLTGVLRKGEQDPAFVRKLVEDGQAFDDLEHVSDLFAHSLLEMSVHHCLHCASTSTVSY